jgi:CelD/BcsL family acetyltransferase involved in cellulose biosynthesis
VATVTEYLPSAHAEAAVHAPLAFAKVEIHRKVGSVLAAWAELEAIAPASAYQTRAFLLPWLETLGAARKIEPLFILAKDRQEQALALFCLGLERHGLLRSAVFLGGKESNFNLGLFRPGTGFAAADLIALLRAAAEALGSEAPDVFLLKNQPFEWEKVQNPFALLPNRASPSFAYGTALAHDGEAFLADKLSKETRKKLRKKEARLSAIGLVGLITNETEDDRRNILDTFFAEKIARFEEQAIDADFSNPATRAFFDRLSHPAASGKPWLEFYGLTLGTRIIATYAGAVHRGRFSAMVNSFDTDAEIAKSSPGDLLLMKLLARQCERGLTSFDLGIGEARYKAAYCDTAIPLFDVVLARSIKGHIFAAYHALQVRLKRAIKRNPQVFATLRRWKRSLLGNRVAALSKTANRVPSAEQ